MTEDSRPQRCPIRDLQRRSRRQGRRAAAAARGHRPLPDLSPLDLEIDPKGCCARLYESDAVRWLLDGQLHPGGERLTRRLAKLAGVDRGQRVLDIACGSGATALLLARELECDVTGVDLGARAIAQAADAARAAGLAARVRFVL